MSKAWLDSLSEDWISQPRSEGSPDASLPSLLHSNPASESSFTRKTSSRIPLYGSRKEPHLSGNDSSLPLSERSTNDKNIPLSQRASSRPSKLRNEIANFSRGRRLSRTVSVSSIEPNQHNTVQHKSLSSSPQKLRRHLETPEWRKRLLHGDLAYGEQRDFFAPIGLENIFKPPPVHIQPAAVPIKRLARTEETPTPCLPDVYPEESQTQREQSFAGDIEKIAEKPTYKEPRGVRYKPTDLGTEPFSDDLSKSSSFHLTSTNCQKSAQNSESNILFDGIEDESQQSALSNANEHAGQRISSGNSVARHEDLSPILISRHNTSSGSVGYAVIDLPPDHPQRHPRELVVNGPPQNQADGLHTPSEDVTARTDDFAHNGKFVNIRRGGGSEEYSFQRKMLSPSSLPALDQSGMLQEESVEASTPKQLPHIRKTRESNGYPVNTIQPASPPIPLTPHSSPSKDEVFRSKSGSGSPLKLFGTYDTFTNQKLLRRLSQFENNLCGEEDADDDIDRAKAVESGIKTTHNTEMNDAYIENSSPSKFCASQKVEEMPSLGKPRAFGNGNLDHFEFSEGSLQCSQEAFEENKESRPISLHGISSEKKLSSNIDSSLSPESRTMITTHTKNIRTTEELIINSEKSIEQGASPILPISQQPEAPYTPRRRNGESEGKRLPRSPLKDPTPKRRRTLHEMDISQASLNRAATESIKESHQQMQSVIGKKRKDARHGDSGEPANPEVLATRQILRPRTHHLSHSTSQDHGRTALSEIHITSTECAKVEQERISKDQPGLESVTTMKCPTALEPGKQMDDNSRRGSVTTQDFLDEAKKIMAGIRGKARTGLTSVEESESENERQASRSDQGINQDDSYQESTREPFSRPPSREGGPLPRLPRKQQDPVVLEHLRIYEEMSDMGVAYGSSPKHIDLAGDIVNGAIETADDDSNQSAHLSASYQSDPPGIRITECPEMQRKRKLSASSAPIGTDIEHDNGIPSQRSTISSGPSTGRSIPTGSSGGSDSRRGMLPHTIASMIPEQAAGMIFDRGKMAWVKRKTFKRENGASLLSSDDTDEDPFGDIPDLTVDETLELQRIRMAVTSQREMRIAEVQRYERRYENGAEQNRNRDLEACHAMTNAASSKKSVYPEQSKKAHPTLCTTAQEAQQTSQSNDQILSTHETRASTKEDLGETVEDIEQEISINESRVGPRNTLRRRNVTISFSSPIASIIEPDSYNHGSWRTEEDSPDDDSVIYTDREPMRKTYGAKSRSSRSTHHSGSRRLSVGGHAFLPRPVSRIDEREEESFYERASNDPQQHRSISITISTPLPTRGGNDQNSVTATSSVAQRSDSLLQLTPLSEFTVHQHDESFAFEVSYISQPRQRKTSNSKQTLSLSVKELVQSITDIEPFEPFWEHIKRIKLGSKRLKTLHMLSKFCGRLEELDVSQNELSQLDGMPGTIRHLRITHNFLSDLTSWNHLLNLQYIDVSNNELTSLDCFENLIHLRALQADNNRIQSIKGVMNLDGLLSLRLRANSLEVIDFIGSSLQRLTDLDLKGNRIQDVRNLRELRSLTALNLEDNNLCSLVAENNDILWTLKYLRLSGNRLEYLDVSRYPNLRLLYLDRNYIRKVTGFFKTKYLDSLSMREQQDGSIIDLSFLNEAFEVRKLFLSGNLLTKFAPSVDFLNLQYLELANCGLEQLHPEFGQMMPNVRTLNLNFNALHDITPLLGIVRLKTLHLAGNRLSRLRRTAAVLCQFLCLRKLDLRGNPLTIGFYPPVSEKQLVLHAGVDDSHETLPINPFTLLEADREKDKTYASRLDMETKMRRRIFELLVIGGCGRLKVLDGLTVEETSMSLKDEVWEELVKVGLVYDTDTATVQNGTEGLEQSIAKIDLTTEIKGDVIMQNEASEKVDASLLESDEKEFAWPAEDSFA